MEIQKFKSRELDLSKPVEMYRCLNRKGFVFSLRQGGKVVGHTTNIILKDCEFIVNKSGKARCIKNKTRNVHAIVKGIITEEVLSKFSFILRYNPYLKIGFHFKVYDELVEIHKADVVYIKNNSIKFQ